MRGFPLRFKFLCDKPAFNDSHRVCEQLMEPYFKCFRALKSNQRLQQIFWVMSFLVLA